MKLGKVYDFPKVIQVASCGNEALLSEFYWTQKHPQINSSIVKKDYFENISIDFHILYY